MIAVAVVAALIAAFETGRRWARAGKLTPESVVYKPFTEWLINPAHAAEPE
jgi:hypothetical protein